MQEFLESILNQCLDILDAESGSVLLFDKDNKDIVVKAARGQKSAQILGQRVKVGYGISGIVAESQRPLLVEDIRVEQSVKAFCRQDDYMSHSFLSVPLSFKGRLVGVLNITEKANSQPFTMKDLSYVSAIAAAAAVTIDKITFAEQVEKQVEGFKNSSAVSRFAAAIAHELNNPLDGTLRYNKLALIHSQDNEIVREYLLEMRQGLKRMENVIRSMLQLSFAGDRTMDPMLRDEVDIADIIEKAIGFYKHEAVYKQIDITTDIEDGIPKIRDCGILQVCLNCIKNSIDAIDRNGRVDIKAFCRGAELIIEFTDNGCGIDPGLRDKILEPFFTTKAKGRGLGLAIVKEVVDCYKGSIDIGDLSQGGARFTVSIPMGGI